MSRIKKPSGRERIQRTVENKLEVRHFLIVCEGGKTEPNYFGKFPQPQNGSITVRGTGANTGSPPPFEMPKNFFQRMDDDQIRKRATLSREYTC